MRYIGRIVHGQTARLIATMITVLTLLAGCTSAEPTATPVPPTNTPLIAQLERSPKCLHTAR